jgi:hypothetical protein
VASSSSGTGLPTSSVRRPPRHSSRSNWPPDEWLEREGLDATVVRDNAEGDLLRAFGVNAYPAWAVVAADGTLVGRRTGLLDDASIAALLASAAG